MRADRFPFRLVLLTLLLLVTACSPTKSDDTMDAAENTVAIPDTAGGTRDAALQAIGDAGLSLGTITEQASDTVPIGAVIGTVPSVGTMVSEGSTVNVVISSGTASVDVPVTAGLTLAEAEVVITDAGLVIGSTANESSNTVPAGQVIRTTPAVGSMAARGASIGVVISTGPADVSVPNVTNLTEAAAVMSITDAMLVAGTVTGEASDLVPMGVVIAQMPVGGAMVSAGTAIDIVVSLGPANVSVPDIAGLSEGAASTAITDAGLVVGMIATQPSVDVAVGDVISQTPEAGTLVALTTAVDLLVSLGPDPLPVPDIVGLTETQATSVLTNIGINVGVVTRVFNLAIPQGEVISQATPPGTLVIPDSMLDFLVSLGAPVSTPNVTGLVLADAEAAIINANLVVGESVEQNDANVPAGSVIAQNPSAGVDVPAGATVNLIVSLGPLMVAAPDVVGQTQSQASASINAAELEVGIVTQQQSASVPAGDVISQTPVADTLVILGSAIDLVISSGP